MHGCDGRHRACLGDASPKGSLSSRWELTLFASLAEPYCLGHIGRYAAFPIDSRCYRKLFLPG